MNRSKVGYVDNIEDETMANENFRKVIYTGPNLQMVLMTLKPGEDIGSEVHEEHDQFFIVEDGEAKLLMDGEESTLVDDEVGIVPAGVEHNVINNGDVDLKLYTLYAPPEHPEGRVDETKPE